MVQLDKRSLELVVNGIETSAQISTGKIASAAASSSFTTFQDARNGGKREYRLVCTGVQDLGTGTFWDLVWSHAGEQVEFYMRPYGNPIPTVEKPHFAGVVTIKENDGDLIGGDADADTSARQTIEVEWVCTGKPVKVTSEADPDYLPAA